jgi:dimethylamine monooxygenase subunit B
MGADGYISLRLQDIETLSLRVKKFTLASDDRSPLPAFSAGSHINLRLETPERRFHNSYSLIGTADRTSAWQIAVQLADDSRGGSRFLHDLEPASTRILSSLPTNSFPLVRKARHHVFIAGGIGITPFLTLIEDAASTSWELHYAVRCRHTAAFCDQLAQAWPDRVRIYSSDQNDRLDVKAVLQNQPLGTHVYVCGPERLISATIDSGRALGWLERYIHFEHFQSGSVGEAFEVELARSGRTIRIESGMSLLEGLEAAGIDMNYSCRGGACGACETSVVSGLPDHRDHYLPEEARKLGKTIMPCVSRSLSQRLVLDL